MLTSPEGYKKEKENKTLEQLVLERTKLFNALVEYEQKHIMDNQPYTNEEIAKPSANDIYNMNNEYLKVITDLIYEKKTGKKINSLAHSEDEEYIKELEKLEKRLFNKNGIYLEIRSGAVLPMQHPHYYDGRVDIILDDNFGKPNCSIKFERNTYTITDEQFNKIKQLIKGKFDLLFEMAKKQTDEMYAGTYNYMLIKFNSIFLNISPDNITNENDFNVFNELKNAIMNIIMPKDEKKSEKTINDLVNKIMTLPNETETSISNLLGDDFREFNTSQLFQINKSVLDICKEKGIIFNFDKYKDQAIGLPFNIPFIISKKLSNNMEFYKKNNGDEIWWINNKEKVGEQLFSFDKQKIYNLFRDYPYELSKEEKEIFDKENPYWADFFKDRNSQNIYIENSNKKTCFKISMSNWGMIGPNSITGNEFIIYDDLSIDLKVSKNNYLGTEQDTSTLHGSITQEKYNEIVKNIEEAKNNFYEVHAMDGNAWAFEEYNNGNLVWKRELGYIYGIAPLTNITSILNSIDYKK